MSHLHRPTIHLARLAFNFSHSIPLRTVVSLPHQTSFAPHHFHIPPAVKRRWIPCPPSTPFSTRIMGTVATAKPAHQNTSEVPLQQSQHQQSQWLPHRVDPSVPVVGPGPDWITPIWTQHLTSAEDFRPEQPAHTHPPRILVLHGTLRKTGFSKLLAYECARLLEALGAQVRVFDPSGLPVRDPELQEHPKVVELRSLVEWSEAHVWSASELHGNLCSVFKNQIDWIPLNSGSVRPTQGKSVAILQVCGGSQSFNVVNTLRLLARWMRMACVVNQSSVPMAWKEFDDDGRMKESSLRDRVVDVMEEFVKFARINREYCDILNDRFSERKEKEEKGRLLTQAEKEAAKDAALAQLKKDKANE